MSGLCKFKEIFGKTNEGNHAHRLPLVDVATIDTAFVFIAALILKLMFGGSYVMITLILFLLGIICHRLFCVNTKIDRFLFGI
jgi:hypothetical protein